MLSEAHVGRQIERISESATGISGELNDSIDQATFLQTIRRLTLRRTDGERAQRRMLM